MGIFDRALRAIGNILAVVPISLGTRTYSQQIGLLAASTEVSAFTGAALGGLVAGKAAEVISLELAFDHDTDVRIKIQPRASSAAGGGVVLLNTMRASPTTYDVMTVAGIRAHGHAFLELIVDNPTTGTTGAGSYKVALKPGFVLPMHNGGDITVLNQNTTTARNVGTQIIVKELIP